MLGSNLVSLKTHCGIDNVLLGKCEIPDLNPYSVIEDNVALTVLKCEYEGIFSCLGIYGVGETNENVCKLVCLNGKGADRLESIRPIYTVTGYEMLLFGLNGKAIVVLYHLNSSIFDLLVGKNRNNAAFRLIFSHRKLNVGNVTAGADALNLVKAC